MQLLTASKLSTVAMLVMASAVFHSPVSAVPMQQSGGAVQVAPVVRSRPNFAVYKSTGPGQPSEQAIKDVVAIFNTLLPLNEMEIEPSPSGDASQPASPPPGAVNQQGISRMSFSWLKKAARKNQGQSDLVKERLPQLIQDLVPKLNMAWDELEKKVKSLKMTEQQEGEFISVSTAWEQTVQEVFGLDRLEECPYELFPYNALFGWPAQRLREQNLSEEKLLELVPKYSDGYKAYVSRNVCRLVVNGAYPWLLKVLAMHQWRSDDGIFSALGQLRLFTPDEFLAHDLDEILKLFAAISKADGKEVTIPYMIPSLLILSTPEVIPALKTTEGYMTEALLLYLAAKKHKDGEDTHLGVGPENLLKTLEIRDINDIVRNYFLDIYTPVPLKDYVSGLANASIDFDRASDASILTAGNSLLDHPSTRLVIGDRTGQLEFTFDHWLSVDPFEVLVNALSLDQFVNLYRDMPNESKGLQLVIMAGRSLKNSEFMVHVFHDVLGKEKAIEDGVQVDGEQLTAKDLSQLVQGCATACTEENWPIFVDLFVNKVKDTNQLPGNDPSPTKLAQQVADEISKFVKEFSDEFDDYRREGREDNFELVENLFKTLTKRVSQVGDMLNSDESRPTNATMSEFQEGVSKGANRPDGREPPAKRSKHY